MVRALFKNGRIEPVDPLPPEWTEGQQLLVDVCAPSDDPAEIDRWARELEEGAAGISAEDARELERALEEVERQSKEAVRREWGLS
jgi:hypothetical protein